MEFYHSKYPIGSYFLTYCTVRAPISFMNLFMEYTYKFVWNVKNTDQTS